MVLFYGNKTFFSPQGTEEHNEDRQDTQGQAAKPQESKNQ